MRVLVTGGCGYLGSVVVRRLLQNGFSVNVIDSGLYGFDSLSDLKRHTRLKMIQGDIRNLTEISEALKDCDYVVHLAGIVGMPATNIDPILSTETNYLATKNLAELCNMKEIPLVFASTCSVYGSQPGRKITETSKVIPLEPYALHKYRCEKEIQQLHWSPAILRFGTLFGLSQRMRFDLVINKFIAQAVHKIPLTVEGGKQMRPFLHVLDASEAIMTILDQRLDGVFNVISENHSILDVASIISSLTGASIKQNPGQTDSRDYSVSIGKIHAFGFNPKYSIGFAINEITKWFEKENVDFTDHRFSNYDSLLFKNQRIK